VTTLAEKYPLILEQIIRLRIQHMEPAQSVPIVMNFVSYDVGKKGEKIKLLDVMNGLEMFINLHKDRIAELKIAPTDEELYPNISAIVTQNKLGNKSKGDVLVLLADTFGYDLGDFMEAVESELAKLEIFITRKIEESEDGAKDSKIS